MSQKWNSKIMAITIKGKQIGTGIPLICVPVMKENELEIVEEIRKLCEKKTQMIEWRIDAFAFYNDAQKISDVLSKVKEYLLDTILLVTFRTREQGGLKEIDGNQLEQIYLKVAQSRVADLVDVEYLAAGQPDEMIDKLHKEKIFVVGSHHNFSQTPSEDEMMTLLETMEQSKVDIVKLAVMPKEEQDVIRLLQVTSLFHKTYPNRPLVTMSMGAVGAISRVAGEFFGSCITFGAAEVASAPGQLPMEDLRVVLDTLHRCIGQE